LAQPFFDLGPIAEQLSFTHPYGPHDEDEWPRHAPGAAIIVSCLTQLRAGNHEDDNATTNLSFQQRIRLTNNSSKLKEGRF
jgi:hypothetical protein